MCVFSNKQSIYLSIYRDVEVTGRGQEDGSILAFSMVEVNHSLEDKFLPR